ncbi:MAG TPA: type II toxin-antitoxin system HigB family toxin [Mucilaginibacter sp.]
MRTFLLILTIFMRIHLIKERTVEQFAERHAAGRSSFRLWLNLIKKADWNVPEDIFCTFGSADLLGNGSDRVVFDIGGNNYRVIAKYDFAKTRIHLTICWIGTHADYTKLCKANKQYDVRLY